MIDKELLEILACPATYQTLAEAPEELVKRLEERRAAGTLRTVAGAAVEGTIEAALVRADGKVAYPILMTASPSSSSTRASRWRNPPDAVRFASPTHGGRTVRLGYCLNVLAIDDLAEFERAIETRARAAARACRADRGASVPASTSWRMAFALSEDRAQPLRARLRGRLRDHGIAAFAGERVPLRTLPPSGAHVTCSVRRGTSVNACSTPVPSRCAPRHSLRTARRRSRSVRTRASTARTSARRRRLPRACATAAPTSTAALVLAKLERRARALRGILALEPEPRSLAGDTREFAEVWPLLRDAAASELGKRGERDPEAVLARHVGLCLDTCHAAVEYEAPRDAARAGARARRADREGATLERSPA
ncbi:MAG: hypothetical protein R3F34_15000 [Planctomycetota bacterium]